MKFQDYELLELFLRAGANRRESFTAAAFSLAITTRDERAARLFIVYGCQVNIEHVQ